MGFTRNLYLSHEPITILDNTRWTFFLDYFDFEMGQWKMLSSQLLYYVWRYPLFLKHKMLLLLRGKKKGCIQWPPAGLNYMSFFISGARRLGGTCHWYLNDGQRLNKFQKKIKFDSLSESWFLNEEGPAQVPFGHNIFYSCTFKFK
jgi:hypothetical protein